MVTARGRIALAAGAAARWSSRVTGRGAGAMIGGLVAMTLDKSILRQLGESRRSAVITGTNGKSTTTRMTAAALGTLGPVATNAEGANMDAGLVAALAGARDARLAALEVDEMHVPHVADTVDPQVIVLLNLSRDQLDRVGEINHIERTLRAGLARHPDTVVVANCDDVLMTSAAYDSPNVVWVAAGGGWANDSVSCPRSGEVIVREQTHWYSTGTDFKRPSPQWWFDDTNIYGPQGLSLPMTLALPGRSTEATPLRPSRRRCPWVPIRQQRWQRHRGSTRSRAATAPCDSARTPCGCCLPRIRPAGRKRYRWSTPTPVPW